MAKFKCGGCGYIWDGEAAPESCPKCGAPKESFVLLDAESAAKVERSRHSNCLHQRVVALAREIEDLCSKGIDDKLDPGCVDVFTKSRAMSWQMMKLSMAEMAGHMGKGKWG